MELSHDAVCEEVLLDLLCYEKYCGHLSPEMDYLFERHLEDCPICRKKISAFQCLVEEDEIVRNFG